MSTMYQFCKVQRRWWNSICLTVVRVTCVFELDDLIASRTNTINILWKLMFGNIFNFDRWLRKLSMWFTRESATKLILRSNVQLLAVSWISFVLSQKLYLRPEQQAYIHCGCPVKIQVILVRSLFKAGFPPCLSTQHTDGCLRRYTLTYIVA